MSTCNSFARRKGLAAGVASFLFIAVFSSVPRMAFAQQEQLRVDTYRVLNETPDFVDMELDGAIDGSLGQVCLEAIAKSTDGSVRTLDGGVHLQHIQTVVVKSFPAYVRVMRPSGLARQQTDFLMVIARPCWRNTILRTKFAWHHVWPKKKAGTGGNESDDIELSKAETWRAFSANLKEEDFAALDALMMKWNDPKERDQNGDWKLDGFRKVFVDYSGGNHDWKADLQRIKRWRAFNPRSAGAAIAEAKHWTAYAWHIRGNDYITQIDPVALKVFGERMQRAERVLNEAKHFADDNPLWYEAYLDIAVATKREEKFLAALFSEAIRRHPHFLPLYLKMAKYWTPRSGEVVDWNKVDGVVGQAVSNTTSLDGAGTYALLYAQISDLQEFEFDLLRDSRVSWVKMRESFEDLVKHYPSADNLNRFAVFACRANDKNTFLRIRPQIINRILDYLWPGNFSYDLCDRRFMQTT